LIHFWDLHNQQDNSIKLKNRLLFDELSTKSISDDQALIQKACHYLLDDLTTHTSLNKLSRLLNTNRNNLSRLFKNKFGMGTFSWVRKQRMMKAANLLTFTNICHEVGYEDSNNFSTSFKKFFGVPPKQYRKKVTGSKRCVTGPKVRKK
jgi:AraC-like DNA-binding protein